MAVPNAADWRGIAISRKIRLYGRIIAASIIDSRLTSFILFPYVASRSSVTPSKLSFSHICAYLQNEIYGNICYESRLPFIDVSQYFFKFKNNCIT